jgi:hypothetical protein
MSSPTIGKPAASNLSAQALVPAMKTGSALTKPQPASIVELCCFFRTYRQVANNDVNFVVFENFDDIYWFCSGFFNSLAVVLTETVKSVSALNCYASLWNITQFDGVVFASKDCFRKIKTDLCCINIECCDKFNVL